mgnify:CR=1 FL=1
MLANQIEVGLEHVCGGWQAEQTEGAAQDTAVLILEALEILVQHPEIGRKVHFGQRELVISRGRTGYLALYRFLPHIDRILILALRHQREAGYKGA